MELVRFYPLIFLHLFTSCSRLCSDLSQPCVVQLSRRTCTSLNPIDNGEEKTLAPMPASMSFLLNASVPVLSKSPRACPRIIYRHVQYTRCKVRYYVNPLVTPGELRAQGHPHVYRFRSRNSGHFRLITFAPKNSPFGVATVPNNNKKCPSILFLCLSVSIFTYTLQQTHPHSHRHPHSPTHSFA